VAHITRFGTAPTPAVGGSYGARMATKLSNSSSSMPQLVELNLADYKTHGASIGCNHDGTTFALVIEPVPDEIVAALEAVAAANKRVCIYCCGEPVLLDLLILERKESRKARIVGRIVDAALDRMGDPAVRRINRVVDE
jgi:hypothetical protein